MKNTTNKVLIPESKGYAIDLETHEVYNSRGNKMKPFVDIRKRVSTKIIMANGAQRTIVIKDLVRKMKGLDANSVKHDAIAVEDYNFKVTESRTYLQVLTNYKEIMSTEEGLPRYYKAKSLTDGVDLHILRKTVNLISRAHLRR